MIYTAKGAYIYTGEQYCMVGNYLSCLASTQGHPALGWVFTPAVNVFSTFYVLFKFEDAEFTEHHELILYSRITMVLLLQIASSSMGHGGDKRKLTYFLLQLNPTFDLSRLFTNHDSDVDMWDDSFRYFPIYPVFNSYSECTNCTWCTEDNQLIYI